MLVLYASDTLGRDQTAVNAAVKAFVLKGLPFLPAEDHSSIKAVCAHLRGDVDASEFEEVLTKAQDTRAVMKKCDHAVLRVNAAACAMGLHLRCCVAGPRARTAPSSTKQSSGR